MKWDIVLYLIFIIPYFSNAFLESRGGCNRTVRNSVGLIRWTGRMGKCIVRIKAPSKDPQIIELRIRRLQVGVLKDSKCLGAYIQFFEDSSSDDLEVDSGRYCGHITSNTTRLFLRKGPDLTLVMNSETKFAAENPVIFSAQYSILPSRLANERHRGLIGPSISECPLECNNRNDRRYCRLVSPGYPGVYPRGIRCRIALESSTGRFSIGSSEDIYSLMNYTHQDGCITENCQDIFEPEKPFETKSSYFQAARIRTLRNTNAKRDEEDEIIISQDNRPQQKYRQTIKPHRTRVNLGRKNNDKLKQNVIAKHLKTQTIPFESNRFRHEGHFKEKILSFNEWNPLNNSPLLPPNEIKRDKHNRFNNESRKFRKNTNPPSFLRRYRIDDKLENTNCLSDYLALLENINGKIFEITKFCGEGHIPQILSRGRNIIIEFYSNNDGTIMHDGFHLTLQEIDVGIKSNFEKNCEFIFKSSDKSREIIKSMENWYPPGTICIYKFLGKITEKVSIQLKIVRKELITNESNDLEKKNNSKSVYCKGNEITIYNGIYENNNQMLWSFCDTSHSDINNIQVPIISSGNSLMIQFYSAKGSFDGQEFTYSISYKFIKKSHNVTRRRQIKIEETKLISLRPVDFSSLNLNESEYCNCDISDRIGNFKSWFMVLVVLGVISFLGAVLTIVAVLTKWLKMRAIEKSLLQTPKR